MQMSKTVGVWLRGYPFTLWGVVALMLHTCISIFGLSYDQGGLAGALVLSSPVWGFMYWLPSELLFALNDSAAIPGQALVSVLAGLVLCLLADLIARRWWRAVRREPEEHTPASTDRGFRSSRS